jgi:drug/metabolite transporter (DMT)-like permease
VFSALTGFLFLGERISADGFAGILLVVLGAYLLNFEFADRGGLKALLAPVSAIIHHRGSRLMLSVAVIYSVTSVFGKGALQYAPGEFRAFLFRAARVDLGRSVRKLESRKLERALAKAPPPILRSTARWRFSGNALPRPRAHRGRVHDCG